MPDTCGVPCGGRGPCNPRFLAAGPDAVIDPSTLWVVTVKRMRRSTASDWANMEHFAASTLPAFEELYRQRIKVDKLALPQVMRAQSFLTARGADTDWFRETALSALDALGAERMIRSWCFGTGSAGQVLGGLSMPRTSRERLLQGSDATSAFIQAAAKRHGTELHHNEHPDTKERAGRPGSRAGPGWSNSQSW